MSLPNTYTQLTYIGCSGSQYIDTNFNPNSNTSIEMGVKVTSFSGWLYGARVWYNDRAYGIAMNYNNDTNYNFYNYGSGYWTPSQVFPINSFVKYEQRKNEVYINDVLKSTATVQTFNVPCSLYLFNCHRSDGTLEGYTTVYASYCKLWDNETLIRDFIPAKRNSDSVLGLYDLVNDVFYTNAGSGTFIGGDPLYRITTSVNPEGSGTVTDVQEYPGYEQLEYIESSGTQYIDSGVKPYTDYDKAFVDFHPTSLSVQYNTIFGGASNNALTMIRLNYSSLYMFFGNSTYWNETIDTNRHNIEMEITSNSLSSKLDDVSKTTLNGNPSTHNSFICANDNQGSVAQYGSCKIYEVKMWKESSLVRDFIPVRRVSDYEVGLLDTINNQFYKNSGTGSFIAGPAIHTLTAIPNTSYSFKDWLLKGYTQLEYIESSGTQYIDSDMNFPNGFRIETKIKLNSNFTQGLNGIVGAHNSNSPYGRNTLAILYHDSYGYKYRFALGQDETTGDIYTEIPASGVSSDTEYDIIAQNFNGNSVLKFGSLVDISSTNSWTRTSNNLYIFAQNNDGTAYAFIKCKLIGYMKIYSQSNTLVRDFIPVIRHSDGAIGLLDLVNLKFYGNSGTGTFIGGPVKEV